MEYEPKWRSNLSDICHDFYKLDEIYSKKYLKSEASLIKILNVDDAIRKHRSNDGDKQLAWNSFKFHSITNIEARYWVGYYYFYHGEDIPELQPIEKEERTRNAIDIFKKTANKGNSSAQLMYGMHLWKNKDYIEAFKYLKMSADAEVTAAMYIVGKAYWNGNEDIEQDKEKGAEYLRRAASKNNAKAREMCDVNNINYLN
jgi:TPR repeat protein